MDLDTAQDCNKCSNVTLGSTKGRQFIDDLSSCYSSQQEFSMEFVCLRQKQMSLKNGS